MLGSSGGPKSIDSIRATAVFPLDVATVVLMLPGALDAVPPSPSFVVHPCFFAQEAAALVTVP